VLRDWLFICYLVEVDLWLNLFTLRVVGPHVHTLVVNTPVVVPLYVTVRF